MPESTFDFGFMVNVEYLQNYINSIAGDLLNFTKKACYRNSIKRPFTFFSADKSMYRVLHIFNPLRKDIS